MKKAIDLVDVKKSLGSFNLGPLTLTVPTGTIVGYIGENGAGKSTTIKLLLGLMKADEGRVRVLGKDREDVSPTMKKEIGYVFDNLYLPKNMTLGNVHRFQKMFYGEAWRQDIFSKLIHRFHLPDGKAIQHFSRGMKMQLSLAMALSHGAKLLLLDEPTSGLDPVIRDDVLDLLLAYRQDEDHTVFISSHILSDLEKLADYIAFIHEGKLLFMEAKDDLLYRYGRATLTRDQLEELDPQAVIGKRIHRFGVDVLLDRRRVPENFELDRVTIEDIMVYMVKGDQTCLH